ncbi:DUF4283 domain protein, partial [Trifolium medium]|nr:DUF4283 domain protein [Trifolium medium]
DDVMVEIKVIEEWGFNLGEDACLFADGDTHELKSEQAMEHGDHELSNHVDMMIEKFADELVEKHTGESVTEIVGTSIPYETEALKSKQQIQAVMLTDGVTQSSKECSPHLLRRK